MLKENGQWNNLNYVQYRNGNKSGPFIPKNRKLNKDNMEQPAGEFYLNIIFRHSVDKQFPILDAQHFGLWQR